MGRVPFREIGGRCHREQVGWKDRAGGDAGVVPTMSRCEAQVEQYGYLAWEAVERLDAALRTGSAFAQVGVPLRS